jgi:hypothetical protein
MKNTRALFLSILTVLLLPIIGFVIYLIINGSLFHPNRIDLISFFLYYLCVVPGGIGFAIWYYTYKYKNKAG